MAKPKTRVVANYENADRSLFSIRENGDQSLTVIFQHSLNDERTDGDTPIRHHKLSIHISPKSQGTTLLRTLLLADGRSVTSSQFIKDSKDSLFCIAFGRLCPQLNAEHYSSKPRARDSVVRIGTFHESDRATLIYHIVVSDHLQMMPFVAGHSIQVIEFAKWKIGIYSCYFNLPASPFGRDNILATRPQKVDGSIDPEFPQGLMESDGADSLTIEQLRLMLIRAVKILARNQLLKIRSLVVPELHDAISNHVPSFHPTVQSLLAERLGIRTLYSDPSGEKTR
jgi:hypothetical protein